MSSLWPDLVAAVAATSSLEAGLAALVGKLSPSATPADVRELLAALTRNTSHLAISADHPGFARAQLIFERGELDAAALLERSEAERDALELGRAKLIAEAEEAREATIAAQRDLEHARALVAAHAARIAELEAAAEQAAIARAPARAARRPR